MQHLVISPKQVMLKRTSAPIGAWICNFPPFLEIMTDRPTRRRTDRTIISGINYLILKRNYVRTDGWTM